MPNNDLAPGSAVLGASRLRAHGRRRQLFHHDRLGLRGASDAGRRRALERAGEKQSLPGCSSAARPDVDAIACRVDDLIIRPGGVLRHREWGLCEVGINGPDGLAVRIGWPSRLMPDGGAKGVGRGRITPYHRGVAFLCHNYYISGWNSSSGRTKSELDRPKHLIGFEEAGSPLGRSGSSGGPRADDRRAALDADRPDREADLVGDLHAAWPAGQADLGATGAERGD